MKNLIKLCIFSFFIIFVFSLHAQESTLSLKKEGLYYCGKQPKQVLFSPDNKMIVLPLLEDNGFQVLDITKDRIVNTIFPPRSSKQGFAEGLFIKEKGTFFVSQMTTGFIYEYEYDYPNFTFKREIDTEGTWSKFIAWNGDTQLIAVSNWVSDDVSLIDYDSGKVLKKIKTAAAPRGLAFVKGGKELLVLCFDGGKIQKFNTETGVLIDSISIEKSAMRHIVVNSMETSAYVSDMYHACIYHIDLDTFSVRDKWKVFNNPNTISLYKDKYLFVSCRGPNNKQDYTKRSPVNGKVFVLNANDGTEMDIIYGGNQPTGLDISSDGKWMCFSNFQDADIELYGICE